MNFLNHKITFPTYVAEASGYEHGPFLMWLTRAMKPKRIVELGNSGYIYCAICEAVRESNLATECFVINALGMDEHAGRIVEEYEKYASFSRLLGKTIEEAPEDFEDGSVDLLHFGGQHSYEVVKHSLEVWAPKLSSTAMILLHGTEGHGLDVGNNRYWSEISDGRTSLNFTHGGGLGVLFWGNEAAEGLTDLYEYAKNEAKNDTILTLFSSIDGLMTADRKLGETSKKLTHLDEELASREMANQMLRRQNHSLQVSHNQLERDRDEMRQSLIDARIKPLKQFKRKVVSRMLYSLSKKDWIFSQRRRDRFLSSAKKRDPKRIEIEVSQSQYCHRIKKTIHENWDFEEEAKFLNRLRERVPSVAEMTVSVIMPTYNRANLLTAAINSVLHQSHANWELIIVDDGSDDNTAEVVESLDDGRIRYFKKLERGGVSAARNTGLERVRNEWVFFLDSDNAWRSDYLETMLRFLRAHDLKSAYCGISLHEGEETPVRYLFQNFSLTTCIKGNYIDQNAFCMHRMYAKCRYDESIRRLVDWDFILRVASKTPILGAPYIGVDYSNDSRTDRISKSEYANNTDYQNLARGIQLAAIQRLYEGRGYTVSDKRRRIAVVFHVHDPEYIDEFLNKLSNIPEPFDLIVTTPLQEYSQEIARIKSQHPDAVIQYYPNVGQDIGPFLDIIPTLLNYDLVCKLHTKRNVDPWGSAWRDTMKDGVLGSEELVRSILSSFDDPLVQAVGPKETYKMWETATSDQTKRLLRELTGGLKISENTSRPWGFFAGSMFWIRPNLLAEISGYLFETPVYHGRATNDGQVEQTLERVIGMSMASDPASKVGLVDSDNRGVKIANVTSGSVEPMHETLDRIAEGMGILLPVEKHSETAQISIKIPAPEQKKQQWGDYHYAEALAKSCRELGCQVSIDFLEDWGKTRRGDDVNLCIRGLSRFEPPSGQMNVLWVISHPDQVSFEEMEQYDLVYVASLSYANFLQPIVQTTVKPLLQATDTDRFRPSVKAATNGSNVLFVGNSRNEYRPIVRWAVDADVDVDVYGTLWDQFLPARMIKGENISNAELPSYYKGATAVLNDHWQSMREFGFISNRIFDVLACGGRLISDEIPAVSYTLGSGVRQVAGPDDLKEAVSESAANTDELSELVRNSYSFDKRAQVILGDVSTLRQYSYVRNPAPAVLRKRTLRVNGIIRQDGSYPQSSAFIRLYCPLTSESAFEEVEFGLIPAREAEASGDVAIVQRTAFDTEQQADDFIRACKASGTRLIMDNDDDFRLIDERHPEFEFYKPKVAAFETVMNAAEQVWVSTNVLAQRYAEFNPTVLENCIDPRLWRNYRNDFALGSNALRLIYAGTRTHDSDFAMIFGALESLAARYDFSLTLIGVTSNAPKRPWLNVVSPDPSQGSYPRFVRWLREQGQFAIGLAPLEDSAFNSAKSDLKLLDYGALGIAPVVSNVVSYRSTIETHGCGILVENTQADWIAALSDLFEDREKLESIRDAARTYCYNERSVERLYEKQKNALFNS
ncbi:glycosyltransferase [Ruegeria sp. Ofav3-42]|uniref:glycosyltransferase n=1 Tax=Ruegeria sp. Ofav3-42 TaxID=2917759 RepID=UPI001EF71BAF|nr:glycosyltransferase [Ruegeria sp. Ofav3-42]MCG7520509.1 glycosyltransferase [Ruegeria sp. Ofav3-42]